MLQPLPVKIGYVQPRSRSSSIRSSLRKIVLVSVSVVVTALAPPSSPAYGWWFSGSKAKTQDETPKQCLKNCQLTEDGYALIRFFEGYSPFIYKDVAGYPTIGYGHLIVPADKGKIKEPLLPPQAQLLLEKDAQSKIKDVNKLVHTPLYSQQFDSVTSFTYNVGSGALKKSTLLKKVNTKAHPEVPAQFERYVYAGGKKVKGLATRRAAEAKLYESAPTN